jgi:SAM-dependent MidA family methyltransferase
VSILLRDLIIAQIRTKGPLTFAEYMEAALYHQTAGYYARNEQRSGRTGDFYTSVDVGSLFGELIAVQLAEMWQLMTSGVNTDRFDLVEVGAGNGRLAHDILEAAATMTTGFYNSIRLHLIERSSQARAKHEENLGQHARQLVTSSDALPDFSQGVIFANELLDAFPTHRVIMTLKGLRETYIDVENGKLIERLGPPSTPALDDYFQRLGTQLPLHGQAEVNLHALDWIRNASSCLERGFIILIDYGKLSQELFDTESVSGTFTAQQQHLAIQPAATNNESSASQCDWLNEPGEWDLTSHIDLTSIRTAAEETGFTTLGVLDQTYFLLGLGAAEHLGQEVDEIVGLKRRLAVRTLLMPGGLGSTHKVLLFGKQVDSPTLQGCSKQTRLT